MAEEVLKSRLGRGLAALLGDVEDEAGAERPRGSRSVPVEFLRPNPRNPRRHFGEAELAELVASIRRRGVIQPILVRPLPDLPSAYEIVAGERRWRAAQGAGLHDVPVIVVEVDDKTSLEYAIIENVQRTDLNAIEEASGYRRLMDDFGYSYTQLAETLGRSRSHLNNLVRLLDLPADIQTLLIERKISAGHARALLSVKDASAVARRIVDKGLSVRDVEAIAQASQNPRPQPKLQNEPKTEPDRDADARAAAQTLEDALGLAVTIHHRGGSGEVRIRYGSLDQFDELCRRLRGPA
jgi:ParB family chromosome partitioning protein